MGRRPRRTHPAAFKAKVALAELAQQHDVHPDQITDSKNKLLAKAADVFGGESRPDEPTVDLKVLHAKPCAGQVLSDTVIGCLIADCCSKALGGKLPSLECSRTLL